MVQALINQAQYLKENGFTEQQTSALIYFQKDHIENVMATKKDIAEVKKDIAEVKKDIENLRIETKKDIENLRTETKKDIAEVKKDLVLKLSGIMGSMITIGVVILGLLIKL